MGRALLFQVHWFLGITAGLVLAVMGVTGATMSFEAEILEAANRGIITVSPSSTPPLTGPQLIARIEAQRPDIRISRLIVERDPTRVAVVRYTEGGSKKRERSYLDPATGQMLGEPRGEAFFETIRSVHRWMALPGDGNGFGRRVTGFAALSLIFFALSGLYLRWPRRPLDWRSWFVLDLRKTGRNLYRALHTVIGSWLILFYLISAGTGLWWSYGWYRDGAQRLLAPARAEVARAMPVSDEPADLRVAWRGFERATGGRSYERITASVRDHAVEFRAKLPGARHDRVSDELMIDGTTGAVISHVPYADRRWGEDLVTSVYELHRGAYWGMPGRIAMTLSSLTMPLFTITGFLLYFARRRRKAALKAISAQVPDGPPAAGVTTIVAFASHTGSAERIARLTAQALPDSAVLPIAALDTGRIASVGRLLIVASTYGEGEPPDAARGFARQLQEAPGDFSHLHYAVLALGDREYPDFCAFGHQVDQWLHAGGAERLFDVIEVDDEDAGALRQWQQQLAGLGARTDQPDWAPAELGDWRLAERRLLNPGSSGGAAFHVALIPPAGEPAWAAGDIVEILPQQDPRRVDAFIARHGLNDTPALRAQLATRILPLDEPLPIDIDTLKPLAHREYSIASVAPSGRVELIVRECQAADGFAGLGSGWLTAGAPIGGIVKARVRSNAAFHAPEDPATPMILIGNGTGLAGLMAHLRQRAGTLGAGPAWLFFGERHPDHDDFHAVERQRLQCAGVLAASHTAWSRGVPRRYVQDALADAAPIVRDAVANGGAIYVCGSMVGMASAVHHVLAEMLGEDVLEAMLAEGRYRRDIY
ncbi:PepSY domain-containing protein [Sphingomonas sp. 179-I 2A4 NHS]|uniref:PepSY domain-containing protein n=2 Tax=Sphingomonas TaxID=13687 RepID=UPI00387962A8